MELLTCTRCKTAKEATTTWFPLHNKKKNGLDSWCRSCRASYRNGINRGKFRAVMPDVELLKLKASQIVCQICSATDDLVIDHCHLTGKIRGRLCNHCNRGLGHFRDNPALLAEAIVYLNRSKADAA